MGLDSEPRMYLRLEDGCEIGGSDKVNDYLNK